MGSRQRRLHQAVQEKPHGLLPRQDPRQLDGQQGQVRCVTRWMRPACNAAASLFLTTRKLSPKQLRTLDPFSVVGRKIFCFNFIDVISFDATSAIKRSHRWHSEDEAAQTRLSSAELRFLLRSVECAALCRAPNNGVRCQSCARKFTITRESPSARSTATRHPFLVNYMCDNDLQHRRADQQSQNKTKTCIHPTFTLIHNFPHVQHTCVERWRNTSFLRCASQCFLVLRRKLLPQNKKIQKRKLVLYIQSTPLKVRCMTFSDYRVLWK